MNHCLLYLFFIVCIILVSLSRKLKFIGASSCVLPTVSQQNNQVVYKYYSRKTEDETRNSYTQKERKGLGILKCLVTIQNCAPLNFITEKGNVSAYNLNNCTCSDRSPRTSKIENTIQYLMNEGDTFDEAYIDFKDGYKHDNFVIISDTNIHNNGLQTLYRRFLSFMIEKERKGRVGKIGLHDMEPGAIETIIKWNYLDDVNNGIYSIILDRKKTLTLFTRYGDTSTHTIINSGYESQQINDPSIKGERVFMNNNFVYSNDSENRYLNLMNDMFIICEILQLIYYNKRIGKAITPLFTTADAACAYFACLLGIPIILTHQSIGARCFINKSDPLKIGADLINKVKSTTDFVKGDENIKDDYRVHLWKAIFDKDYLVNYMDASGIPVGDAVEQDNEIAKEWNARGYLPQMLTTEEHEEYRKWAIKKQDDYEKELGKRESSSDDATPGSRSEKYVPPGSRSQTYANPASEYITFYIDSNNNYYIESVLLKHGYTPYQISQMRKQKYDKKLVKYYLPSEGVSPEDSWYTKQALLDSGYTEEDISELGMIPF